MDNFLDSDDDGILDFQDAFQQIQLKPMTRMEMDTETINQEIILIYSPVSLLSGRIQMAMATEIIGAIHRGTTLD